MLALIIVLSLATGGLTSLLCPIKVDPQVTVNLPHPTSCSRFLSCVGIHPVEMECPAGLHWNVELSMCDYPQASGCSRGNDSLPLEPKSFNSTVVANSICLPHFDQCPLNSNPSESIIFLRHASDCRKFYACVSAQQVELSCPPGLYWNSRGCVCDYEPEGECNVSEDVPEEAGEVPSEGDQEVDQEPEAEQPDLIVDAEPEEDQEIDHEPEAEEPEEIFVPARKRRAADGEGTTTEVVTEITATATATTVAATTAATSATTAASGSGGSGGSGTTASGGSGGGPVESGADVRTVSSIVVLAFAAVMSVL